VVSFDSPEYEDCYYGFELIDPSKPFDRLFGDLEMLIRSFKSVFDVDPYSNGRWPAWRHWEFRYWNDKVMRQIKFEGSTFDDEFGKLMNGLFDVAKSFAMEMAHAPPLPNQV
jgi:hypothetical protein